MFFHRAGLLQIGKGTSERASWLVDARPFENSVTVIEDGNHEGNFFGHILLQRKRLVCEALMTDPVEDIVAPAAIERALSVYQRLNPCDQSVLLQARKIVTQHIYGMVDKGECDEQRLTVGGLARLRSIERDHEILSASESRSEGTKSKCASKAQPDR